MTNILIELEKGENLTLEQNISELGVNAQIVESSRFDGETMVQILASINAVSLPLLAKLISDSIKANKHVVVKKDGVSVQGLSAKDTLKVLKELQSD